MVTHPVKAAVPPWSLESVIMGIPRLCLVGRKGKRQAEPPRNGPADDEDCEGRRGPATTMAGRSAVAHVVPGLYG